MAQFKYTLSQKGKESSGIIEAASLSEAAERLQEQGGYILELKQRFSLRWGGGGWLEKFAGPLTERMSASEKIFFTTQMGSMLKAGLPITKAIEVFIDEKPSGASLALRRILGFLEAGKNLSETMAKSPKIFDKVYVNVVRAGETMGKLAESLSYLGQQLKREHELVSRVRSAMIYPAVVLTAMAGVMLFVALSVVPKIITFAKSSGAQLPRITQVMVGLTEFLTQWWWLVIIVIVAAGGVLWQAAKTKEGQRFIDGLWLRLPLIKELVRRYNQARFARLLSGFYRYGISVEAAFSILGESLSNYHYQMACQRMRNGLVRGQSLSSVLEKEKGLFSPIMERVVKGAERTGALDEALLRLALFYEEELETNLKNLTTVIEPVLIVLLGVGVIGIALAVIVPIYRVTSQLR